MRYKNIVFSFWLSLVAAVFLRMLQLLFAIDPVTGFYKSAYQKIGVLVSLVIVIICIIETCISLSIKRAPVKMPKSNKKIGVISFLFALSVVYEITSLKTNLPPWQAILTIATGILAALYFGAFGIKCFFDFKLPKVLSAVPVVYFCVKLIYYFTKISTISMISSNLLILAAQIFILLFMFEFAKLANGIDTDNAYKKISFTGFVGCLLCAVASIPSLLYTALFSNANPSTSHSTTVFVFVGGLFIYVFLRAYFSGRNLKEHRHHHHHHHHTKFMKGSSGNNFYLG